MKSPAYFIGTPAITENLLKRRWSTTILRHLSKGPTDPVSICKLEPELSLTAVNERIRTMLRYSLINRRLHRAAAKIVLYELTDRGHKILRMLTLIEQLDEIEKIDDIVLPPVAPPPAQNPPPQSQARPRRPAAASRTRVSPSRP